MLSVLDELEQKKNKKRTFSKLSLVMAIIIIVLFNKLNNHIMDSMEAGNPVEPFLSQLQYVILLFLIFGAVCSILSFGKKEPTTWFKWLGAILNLTFFLLIISSLIFVLIKS